MRTKYWLSLVAGFLALSVALSDRVKGADLVAGTEVAAAVNVTSKNLKVQGVLFLPDGISRLRSLLVVLEYGHSDLIYESQNWRRATKAVESGLMHLRVRPTSSAVNNFDNIM